MKSKDDEAVIHMDQKFDILIRWGPFGLQNLHSPELTVPTII